MSTIVKRLAGVAAAAGTLVALLPLAGFTQVARQDPATRGADALAFTIPADDGYGVGISDCMQPGQTCGAAVAQAWCQAHGHDRSVAFGMGADVTGSIRPAAALSEPAEGDVLIRCSD